MGGRIYEHGVDEREQGRGHPRPSVARLALFDPALTLLPRRQQPLRQDVRDEELSGVQVGPPAQRTQSEGWRPLGEEAGVVRWVVDEPDDAAGPCKLDHRRKRPHHDDVGVQHDGDARGVPGRPGRSQVDGWEVAARVKDRQVLGKAASLVRREPCVDEDHRFVVTCESK